METNTIRIKEDETNQELFKEIEEFFSIGGLNTPIDLITREHNKRFKVENASLKLEQNKASPSNIRFTINGTDIFDWFKHKQQELFHSIGVKPSERNNKGMKI